MKRNARVRICIVLLAACCMLLCSRNRPGNPNPTHQADWNNSQSPYFHGIKFLNMDDSLSCKECHGADYSGGKSTVSCYACHIYPHQATWQDTTLAAFHGQRSIASGTDSCAACHGITFTGGMSKVTCYTCHNYPHLPSWSDTASSLFHGTGRLVKPYANCAVCHVDSLVFGMDSMRCISIWDNCATCHGANFAGGRSRMSCYSCHAYPHLPAWFDSASPAFHGTSVIDSTKDMCTLCHGADFTGGTVGKSCYTCHAVYPHYATWADSISDSTSHGFLLLDKALSYKTCKLCHGADYAGGRSRKSCGDCHVY